MRLKTLKIILLVSLLNVAAPLNAASKAQLEHRLQALQSLIKNSNDYQRFLLLDTTAKTAYDLDNFFMAEKLSNELLKLAEDYADDWNYSSAIHNSHIIIGKIAFRKKNYRLATKHLLAAAKVPESYYLDNHGPDTTLANMLLHSNNKLATVRYLQQIKKIWHKNNLQLNQWLKLIGEGKKPDLNKR